MVLIPCSKCYSFSAEFTRMMISGVNFMTAFKHCCPRMLKITTLCYILPHFLTITCMQIEKVAVGTSGRPLSQSFLPRCMECRRGLAMRFLSVCLSVCPSVKRVDCDKTKEKSVHIFIPCERPFTLVV